MILKDMKYNQLLHLAYYMDEMEYKYKEEVYREGDAVDFLFLVERGEFHFSKVFVEGEAGIGGGIGVKKNKKKDRPKRYDVKLENPNRIKNSKSMEMKIGLIEGNCGQCFG